MKEILCKDKFFLKYKTILYYYINILNILSVPSSIPIQTWEPSIQNPSMAKKHMIQDASRSYKFIEKIEQQRFSVPKTLHTQR